MWELDYKESWVPQNWCFSTMVLEKTLENPLDCKEIKPINPKGNQPWIFTGRTDAEAEAPILWLPDGKSWLTGKYPDAGKDWRQEEKRVTEDEMVSFTDSVEHEVEKTPGVHPNPCPLSLWCHPTISSSVVPFSFFPQSFLASGAFLMSQSLALGSQSIGASASASVFSMNI